MSDRTQYSIVKRMEDELEVLRSQAQFRQTETPTGIPLSSNDYLGFSTHPRLKEAVIRAVEHNQRVCSTGSRLLSGAFAGWESLERKFADFVGSEAALYFSSGYAANIG